MKNLIIAVVVVLGCVVLESQLGMSWLIHHKPPWERCPLKGPQFVCVKGGPLSCTSDSECGPYQKCCPYFRPFQPTANCCRRVWWPRGWWPSTTSIPTTITTPTEQTTTQPTTTTTEQTTTQPTTTQPTTTTTQPTTTTTEQTTTTPLDFPI